MSHVANPMPSSSNVSPNRWHIEREGASRLPSGSARQTIVVLAALAAEVARLGDLLGGLTMRAVDIWSEHHGSLSTTDIVVIQSGVGMTAAAAAAEHAISAHKPRCVINFGSGGSHVRDLLPGDIVIANRVIACNTLQILATGEELFIDRQFRVQGQTIDQGGSVIECDPKLVILAQAASANWAPVRWPNRRPTGHLFAREPSIRTGPVISADMWVQSPDRIDALHRRHHSLAADMESAASGQVAFLHRTPFLAIKDISNNELYVNSDIRLGEIAAPLDEVGKRSASLVSRLLRTLAAQEP